MSIELPVSWVTTTVGEVYQVIGGGTPATGNPDYWNGDTPWITSADIEGVRQFSVRKYVSEKGIAESTTNKVPAKTLLVVTRVGLGKIAITETPVCFSQDLQGLIQKPDFIYPEFALYLLSYQLQFLKYEGQGTTISGVTKKQLKDLAFPLPPHNEQHRIVTKIEELFSELDKGIENLKTAQAQLKVYRQALLKHAFEGKLTAQWRAENQDKLETADALLKRIQQERAQRYQQQLAAWQNKSPSIPLLQSGKTTSAATSLTVPHFEKGGLGGICRATSKPKALKPLPPLTAEELAELPELPEGWGWVRLASVVTVISGYAFKSGDFVSAGVPVVKIANVGYSEFVDKDQEYLDSSFLQTQKDFLISPNDFLLALTRPITNNRTKVCRYPLNAPHALLNQRVSAMKRVEINPEFLYSYFGTSFFKGSIRSKFSETLQPNLSPKDLEACPIPICSLAEQAQIFGELEARLSEVDQLEQTITTSLQQSEALRQSILKKAFSGQLVPQDPHDEPASTLLARIQAERATAKEGLVVRPRGKRG